MPPGGHDTTVPAGWTETVEPALEGQGPASRPYLILFSAGATAVFPLPRDGEYVLGRDAAADVRVEDRAISRRHARIDVSPAGVMLHDLGSSHGTRVNGTRIEAPMRLAPGDVLKLGDSQLIFQHFGRLADVPSVLPPAQFHQRLVAEVERSLRYVHPFSLLLVRIDPAAAAIGDALARSLRLMDCVGQLDPQTLGVLLPELNVDSAPLVAERLLGRVRLQVPESRAGLACWPDDGCDADALLVAARAGVERAQPGALATAEQAVRQYELAGRRVAFADPATVRLCSLCERLAGSDLPVLVLGETGVGKEIFASLIHHLSARATGPFQALNCAALPESLAEAELFGHARGAFTGADQARAGRLRAAHGGTLFLDEVGELSPAVQAKLLRVLEERRVVPLGSGDAVPVDLRLVAATNRDLPAEIEAGRFRRDLYYRLCGASLFVPPLRERPREIPLLARLLLEGLVARSGREPMVLAPETLRVLGQYAWPGNVRQLANVIEQALTMATGHVVEPWALPEALLGAVRGAPPRAVPDEPPPSTFRPLDDEVRELEARRMREALLASGGVQVRAAALLRMPLRTFQVKQKQYGIESGRRKPG